MRCNSVLFFLSCFSAGLAASSKPNIVIVVADDMGWNDVSFHGSNQILTPNLDALAYDGIILNRHYVPPMCTPSRASLMTGKYPIHTGMQNFVIPSDEPWGLGLHEKLMPQFFRDAGYRTHLVGKWHLGFFEKEYTPTYRGFDEHIGYLGPYIDYWNHSLIMEDRTYSRGHDMRRNLTVDRDSTGIYATDHFSRETETIIQHHDLEKPLFLLVNHLAPHAGNYDDPLQAPEEEVLRFHYISDKKRRKLAAMISMLDKSVGQLVAALKRRRMLDNTIILFYSDNGAPSVHLHSNQGSNFPLKGQKNTPFEGGSRVPAFIWSNLLRGSNRRVSNQLFHNVDWLPTLLDAAIGGGNVSGLDGMSQWKSLVLGTPGLRTELLINIDDEAGYVALIKDGWKFVEETLARKKITAEFIDGREWLGAVDESERNITAIEYAASVRTSLTGSILKDLSTRTITNLREAATVSCGKAKRVQQSVCHSTLAPCLFNILKDPCELNTIDHRGRIREFQGRIDQYRSSIVTPRNQPADPGCDPATHDMQWTFWKSK